MNPQNAVLGALCCPACHTHPLRLVSGGHHFGEPLPERGSLVCDACGRRYPIEGHILDLGHERSHEQLTAAGRSNLAPFAPEVYEHIWRPRSMAVLSSGRITVQRELALMSDWLSGHPQQLVLDLGASTGVYARALARSAAGAGAGAPVIVALDLSRQMLEAARRHALREGLRQIVYVRANAESLPFSDGAFDSVVCGGSLNEFRSPRAALHEARRILRDNGRLFAMNLTRASTTLGRLGQAGAARSGIRFPSARRFDAMLSENGWHAERQTAYGVVNFNLLKKAQSGTVRA